MTRFFITATGTDIGKTFTTAYLLRQARARGLRARALKPLLSGFDEKVTDSDAHILLAAMGRALSPETLDQITPWRFVAPLSPDMAAAREGRSIDMDQLLDFCRDAIHSPEDILFIEGVGGAFVPLDDRHLVADWIKALKIPTILVAGSYLGTISHTIATVTALRAKGIDPLAIILSESEQSPVPIEETSAALSHHLDHLILTLPRHAHSNPDILTELIAQAEKSA